MGKPSPLDSFRSTPSSPRGRGGWEELIMTEQVSIAWVSGITGIAGVILGVLVAQIFEYIKRKSEEKRWYIDYFLGKKIDAFSNIYTALIDCHFVLNLYGNYPPASIQEFRDKISPKEEAYLHMKAFANIYLDEEGEKLTSASLGAFGQASMAIWLNTPGCPQIRDSYSDQTRTFDWKLFTDTYNNTVAWLKKELSPGILKSVGK
jgi:hypothetical protein